MKLEIHCSKCGERQTKTMEELQRMTYEEVLQEHDRHWLYVQKIDVVKKYLRTAREEREQTEVD